MSNQLSKFQAYTAGICSLIVTAGIARFSYTPMLPILQSSTGLSEAEGGWLATANYLGYLFGVLLAASLHNVQHKYYLHRLYLLLSVVTSVAMAATTDVWAWALLRLIAGTCTSGGMIIASGLILRWLMYQGHRGEIGIHFSGLGLGIIICSLLVEVLLQLSATWQQQWFALAAFAAVFAVPAWLWMPWPSEHVDTNAVSKPKDRPQGRNFYLLMMPAYFCAGYGYVVAATFIVDLVEDSVVLSGYGQFVFILVGLAATPAALLWDRVARKLGYLKALLFAYGLQIMGVLLPTLNESLGVIALSALLYGGTFVGCVSLVLTLAGKFFPSNPAKLMGKMTLAYGAAQIIAPALTGYMAESLGDYNLGLRLSAAILFVGFCFVFVLVRQGFDTNVLLKKRAWE